MTTIRNSALALALALANIPAALAAEALAGSCNIAPNGGFTQYVGSTPTAWSLGVFSGSATSTLDFTQYHNASPSVRVSVSTPGDINLRTTEWPGSIPVSSNTTYKLSAWLKAQLNARAALRVIEWNGGVVLADRFLSANAGTGTWEKLESTFATGAQTTAVSIRLVHHISPGVFYWDDVTLEPASCAVGGFDPGMRIQCVKGPGYVTIDGAACTGYAREPHWFAATDNPLVIPNQSGLATYTSFPQPDGSFVGRLTTDKVNYADPVGPGHFLWNTFHDHRYEYDGFQPLLRFDQSISLFVGVNYNDWTPAGGSARGFIGIGADDGVHAWQLEIDCNHLNWGDNVPADPRYINVPPYSEFGLYFAHLWGPAWGCACERLVATDISLDVTQLFLQASQDNPVNFPQPPGGWGSLRLISAIVGTETYQEAIADIWFSRMTFAAVP